MKKYHIIGINKASVRTYFLLKNLHYKVTISDLSCEAKIKKKLKIKKFNKNFFFKTHPEKIISNANNVIYSSGVVKNLNDYKYYLEKKKNISEIDLFSKISKWPLKNILFVTGSRGKSSVCRNIYRKLLIKKYFKRVFYLDRNKLTFSNLPKFQNGFFLIAEIDYQTLLITRYIKAKYRIFVSFFQNENKVFKELNLYRYSKLKIFNNLQKKNFILTDASIYKKFESNIKKYKNQIGLIQKKKTIKDTNNLFANEFIKIIKKELNVKN